MLQLQKLHGPIISPTLSQYIREHNSESALTSFLAKLEQATLDQYPEDADMLTGPDVAPYLQLLMLSIRAEKVLEVGTFTGYSAILMACTAFNISPEAQVTTIDTRFNPLGPAFAKEALPPEKINFQIGDARAFMARHAARRQECFDFILLDGEKSEYPEYWSQARELVRVGGMIVVDDTIKTSQYEKMDAFNKMVHDDQGFFSAILPAGEGLTVAIKL